MDIKTVKLFFSCQRIQPGNTFPLFCTFELIKNSLWPNSLFVPAPRRALQLCLKFCSKQAKTAYFDQHARSIPKHNLLWYYFTNAVTKHQKSVPGCFLLLELNLDLWHENRCFTNVLFTCLVLRATKEFT